MTANEPTDKSCVNQYSLTAKQKQALPRCERPEPGKPRARPNGPRQGPAESTGDLPLQIFSKAQALSHLLRVGATDSHKGREIGSATGTTDTLPIDLRVTQV